MTHRPAALAVAGTAALLVGCAGHAPAGERPIVLITLDTTRADRIGAYGGTAVSTPNLDRLAREGVVFEEALSQVPLTLPAHASLFTARYPASHGVRHNGIYALPAEAETLAERLQDAGYDTAAFVSAYVLNRGFGVEQGFATYEDVPVNRYAGGQDQLFLAERSAGETNARVFEWLERAGETFFLWVHYYDPHDPYAPPEDENRVLEGQGYDREISYVDACLGDLLQRLDATGALDDAIVIVAGDHGESLGEHDELTHGIFLYEEALHVPLIVRAPGLLPVGRRVAGPVELVDVAPTLLELLGVAPLAAGQGRSLLPRIDGSDDGRVALAHAETLMPRLEFGWSELSMVRDGRFKYIRAPRPELYDLHDDPNERHDLAANDPERVAEMSALLERWLATSGDASAEARAGRTMSAEDEAALRSLGYLGGESYKQPAADGARPDPKDMIREVRALDAARDRLDSGDAQGALEAVETILADNPSNHQASNTRILALIELGRLDDAEAAARRALDAAHADPDTSDVMVRKALGMVASVLQLRGKFDEAERHYRLLIELDPDDPSPRVDFAWLLIGRERLDAAEALVDEVLAADPRHGMALSVKFIVRYDRKDTQAALAAARRLAVERAGDGRTLGIAGRLLAEHGEPEAAVDCFETALEQLDDLDPALLGELGIARMRSGDLDGAERALVGVARLSPADPRPYRYLTTIALHRGDEQRARELAAAALERSPLFVAPLLELAGWLEQQGREAEALDVVERALRTNPHDPAARAARARLAG